MRPFPNRRLAGSRGGATGSVIRPSSLSFRLYPLLVTLIELNLLVDFNSGCVAPNLRLEAGRVGQGVMLRTET